MSKKISAIAVVALLMLATAQMAMAAESVADVTGNIQVAVCPVGTIGIGLSQNSLNFGSLLPGNTATENLAVTVNANGYQSEECNGNEEPPGTVDVRIDQTEWSTIDGIIMSVEQIDNTIVPVETEITGLSSPATVSTTQTVTFSVTPPADNDLTTPGLQNQPSGVYTQVITLIATY